MAHFIIDNSPEHNPVNLDLCTNISHGTGQSGAASIVFHFGKDEDNVIVWVYKSAEEMETGLARIRSKLRNEGSWYDV